MTDPLDTVSKCVQQTVEHREQSKVQRDKRNAAIQEARSVGVEVNELVEKTGLKRATIFATSRTPAAAAQRAQAVEKVMQAIQEEQRAVVVGEDYTHQRDQAIIDAANRGIPIEKIGTAAGIDRSNIYRIINSYQGKEKFI